MEPSAKKIDNSTTTPVLKKLMVAQISYGIDIHDDDLRSDKGFALDSSDAMGVDPATVFKTIMAEIGRKYVVATVPVDTNLHLKKLARAGPGKRTEVMVGYPLFVDTELARPPCPAEDVHMGQRRISSDNGPPGPEGAAGGSSSQNRSIAQRSR